MDNQINSKSQLLKISEVAKYLNISRSFAYQLINAGEIPHVRIGSAKRVRVKDLEDYIIENISPRENEIQW